MEKNWSSLKRIILLSPYTLKRQPNKAFVSFVNMSFFVTLPSHSSKKEFPNNTSNAFKVRLPTPLRLVGDGWKVGISSISLPDTNVNLSALAEREELIFGETCYIMLGSQRIQKSLNLKLRTIDDYDWTVSDGVSFMKGVLKWTDKRFQEENWRSYEFYYLDNNKNTCLKWTWQGEDLFLDNSNVARHRYTQTGIQTGIQQYRHTAI